MLPHGSGAAGVEERGGRMETELPSVPKCVGHRADGLKPGGRRLGLVRGGGEGRKGIINNLSYGGLQPELRGLVHNVSYEP